MAWSFGDSFDLYATPADMINGYWDAASAPTNMSFVAGRFSGSQAANWTTFSTSTLIKTSGVNDAAHHFVCSFQQSAALSGTNLGLYFELFDSATAQCSVVFRSDGAILLASGGPAGTVLATYTGAVAAINTWYAFEFEVVINNTIGSFAVRKNGNSVNDFSATALNTRPTSTNNYANKLQIGESVAVNAQRIDDFFWQSGATTGSWLGDIRCYARMPASDASVTFSRSPTTFSLPPFSTNTTTGTLAAGTPRYNGFVSQGGSLASVNVTMLLGYTGNLKCAIFACVGSTLGAAASVGAILGTATASIVNPIAGVNTFTFSPAISLPQGTLFYVGVCSDTATGASSFALASALPYNNYAATSTTAYASFPVASPSLVLTLNANINVAPAFASQNSLFVSEPQQDGLTSYVFDSNPGDADFYGVGSIASTPATVIATTIRAYMQKSDAGTRTAAVQLKSGATTVASPTLTLSSSGWLWAWRTDLTDPNTGAAWTATAVNNAQIGPKTVA